MKRFFLFFVCLGTILTFLFGQFLPERMTVAQESQRPLAQSELAGKFDSILMDFQETPQALSQLSASLEFLSQTFSLTPTLNSEFSQADHVYVMPGDRSLLDQLLNSDLAAQTEFIEPNYIYDQSAYQINDPDYAKQWNLRQINMEGAWQKGATGRGVTVAVIDTGISQGPDLNKTEMVKGYDFVNDRAKADDDNGHGTHVAGTIAQSTNNGYGVAGVAYQAKLMPLKVLSRGGSGTVSDIAESIRFAADHGANVINMSLGGGGESKLMREAIDYAHKKGVVIVAAAGNEGQGSSSYPALYPNVISVSAVGPDQKKTNYSNYGTGVDIAAPGGATRSGEENGILQETINPRATGKFQFKYFQGTSMASPHVAGVAALVKSRQSNLSPDGVWDILKASALPVTGDSQNFYGAGLLDAEKAVKLASPIGFDWSKLDLKGMIFKLAVAVILTGLLVPRGRGFQPFRLTFLLGIMWGSIGLFFFKAISVPFLPEWPFQLIGSSIPELGNVLGNSPSLNPVFVNLIIPFGLMAVFISSRWKWLALGIAIGMTAFMVMALLNGPTLWLIGSGLIARIYLVVNIVMSSLLIALFARTALDQTSIVKS